MRLLLAAAAALLIIDAALPPHVFRRLAVQCYFSLLSIDKCVRACVCVCVVCVFSQNSPQSITNINYTYNVEWTDEIWRLSLKQLISL